jgi:hypothetical protein
VRLEAGGATLRHRLQDEMSVDPAEPHGADARPRRELDRPGTAFPERAQSRSIAAQLGVGLLAADGRRQDRGVEGHRRLDQPGDARGGLRVPNFGLDRADGGRPRRGRGLAQGAAQRAELGGIADACPGPVSLEVGHRLDAEVRTAIGTPHRQELALDFRSGDPALAVGRDPPAADDGDDPPALGQGVGQPHQHDDPAAFPRPEAGRARVVDPHLVLRQGTRLGEADQLERVEARVDPTGQRRVEVPGRQRRAGLRHRQQRRGAGPIDRVAAPLEIELVADRARDRIGEAPGERLGADRRERGLELRLEPIQERAPPRRHPALCAQGRLDDPARVGPAEPQHLGPGELAGQRIAQQHPGRRAGQAGTGPEARVGQRLRGHVQRQPVRQVGRAEAVPRDPEGHAIEVVALDQRRLGRVGPIGGARVGRPVIFGPEPFGRNPSEGAPARQHVLPQLGRRARIGIERLTLALRTPGANALQPPCIPPSSEIVPLSAGSRGYSE